MLSREGKLSFLCFSVASIFAVVPEILVKLEVDVPVAYCRNIWLTHLLQYVVLNLLLILSFRGFSYQVAVRAAFLGYVFGIGILVWNIASPSWQMFGVYISVLTIFHYSEFLSIAWINPASLSVDSFILNHSVAYGVAACSSWIEFIVERQYFPEWKENSFVSYTGITLCISGEVLRKLAMFTAKHNFNHIVQNKKADEHQLITHGVYRLCRHPSYVGWFYWSIGTQLILQNPFCLLAYAIISWRFFHDRIMIEEMALLTFFGEDYVEYQKKVGTGLPFIEGCRVDEFIAANSSLSRLRPNNQTCSTATASYE